MGMQVVNILPQPSKYSPSALRTTHSIAQLLHNSQTNTPTNFSHTRTHTHFHVQVPRGQEINFDFSPIAGASLAMKWGAHSRAFHADVGNIIMTMVASFLIGPVLIQDINGDSVTIESVKEGLGAEAAGLRAGGVIHAVTAITVPKAANLVNEVMGAVYIADSRNPNLFPEAMEALMSNAVPNGGYGKAVLSAVRCQERVPCRR